MTTMASQITSLTVVYSIVYLGVDQRKHQSSASLAFVQGIHRDRWIPRTKGRLRGKCFNFWWRHHVITVKINTLSMTSGYGNAFCNIGLLWRYSIDPLWISNTKTSNMCPWYIIVVSMNKLIPNKWLSCRCYGMPWHLSVDTAIHA